MAIDLPLLSQWLGREEQARDVLTAAPLAGLAATLDRDDPPPQAGDALPPLAHWLYFLPRHRQSELGPDGHARRGGFLPPVALPRRMWAGGRLEFRHPLRVGEAVVRTSQIVDVRHKSGRSGDLVFVLVRHRIENAAGLALVEEHDIVYREAARPGAEAAAGVPAPADAAWQRDVISTTCCCFVSRSPSTATGSTTIAATSRRSSYPARARPAGATLLDLLQRELPAAIARFEFSAPASTPPLRICGRPRGDRQVSLWVADGDGFVTVDGTATLA
jgi:3-methylfumaryl-CoA hydratase